MNITELDFLAIRISRQFKDGSLAFLGVSSGVHLAALRVAQATTCPRLAYIEKGGRFTPARITINGEMRHSPPPIATRDLDSMIDLVDWRADFFDVAMLGGIQIDRYGNVNMIAVGPYDKPALRGPGTIGASALSALVHETHLVAEQHTARNLVNEVDHCSGLGHHYKDRTRSKLGMSARGPVALHTPLASFNFEGDIPSARLVEVVGDANLAGVQKITGFEVIASSRGVHRAPPPTQSELDALEQIRADSD